MAIERIAVNPEVLIWARKTAGYSKVEDAAKKLVMKPEKLSELEDGSVNPSIPQLRKLAKCYKRPLVVLLLPEQPKDFSVPHEYRRLNNEEQYAWSPGLHAEFKRAISQRETIIELSEIAPEVVTATTEALKGMKKEHPGEVARKLRKLLKMDSWTSEVKHDPNKALNEAIQAVEEQGILVMHSRGVDISEMRGMSISEWPHPVIILNGSDWPRPRLFTLIHELMHLVLNTAAICDLHERQPRKRTTDDDIEHTCNRVAASVLMPREMIFQDKRIVNVGNWNNDTLFAVAKSYSASSEALLLRLIELKITDWQLYDKLKPEIDKNVAIERERLKQKQRESEGGPNWYIVKARDIGHEYAQTVISAYNSHRISSYDVADYLGIRYDQLAKLQERIR